MASETVDQIHWSHPPPYTGQCPLSSTYCTLQCGLGCKSQDLLHWVSRERATFGLPDQRTACEATQGIYVPFNNSVRVVTSQWIVYHSCDVTINSLPELWRQLQKLSLFLLHLGLNFNFNLLKDWHLQWLHAFHIWRHRLIKSIFCKLFHVNVYLIRFSWCKQNLIKKGYKNYILQ